MIRIGLIGPSERPPLELPSSAQGRWRGRYFEHFTPEGRYDWVVVLHRNLTEPVTIVGDPSNVAYVSREPAEYRDLSDRYFAQFSRVVATDPRIRHPHIVRRTGMGWWVGRSILHEDDQHVLLPDAPRRLMFDDLVAMEVPVPKLDRVSVVTSTKNWMPGHVARNRLIDRILAHPVGRHVDVFGGGRAPLLDKWDAVAPYRYHLALENCVLPDYWTEKLSDAYLGFALPLYFGCPNIDEYFPPASVVRVNAFRPRTVIDTIERVLDERLWDSRLQDIVDARHRVLGDHHPLSVIADVCDRPARAHEEFVLRPPTDFPIGRMRTAWRLNRRRVYVRTRGRTLFGRSIWRLPP